MQKSLFIILALALVMIGGLGGCGGGSGQSHVASHPNGPPKPRPPPPEPLSSPNHMQAAIAKGVAFAREKYKNKQLDYDHPKASFYAENPKSPLKLGAGATPPGS